jgi:glycosyltransferase involved in cell wall biosynthesis
MGEMLALGLPIVTNSGVGDVDAMVEDMDCGAVVRAFSPAAYAQAIADIRSLSGEPQRRRDRALPWFDVCIGIDRYDQVYRALLAPTVENPAASNARSNRPANSSRE